MKKKFRINISHFFFSTFIKKSVLSFLILLVSSCFTVSLAQTRVFVKGIVVTSKQEAIIGATVVLKENKTVGTITDIDGKFTLSVPNSNGTIVISYLGMLSQEIQLKGKTNIQVTLEENNQSLQEIVVVGFGQQKKESVVGAITQTTGKVLERAGGISNIGAALTGNLPGVVTMQSTGMPGEEDPKIIIRGISSWNGSDPLVLVDGIERPMTGVDISSVETVSVLKDASATAVFGVKGANGVILITTKRGKEGAAKIDVSANMTVKTQSKLPNKYDSYDALRARNVAIEQELGVTPGSWAFIKPQSIIDKYRYPSDLSESERYPNVDWQEALFKDYTTSNNVSLNVSGGNSFVKYFTSADFLHEGDILEDWDNGRNYESGYGYNRLNVRSNLDFQITKTTQLKVNISGSNGIKKTPWNQMTDSWAIAQQWAGAYNIAPDVYLPQYSDGSWGFYPNQSNVSNSASQLALSGIMNTTTTRIATDFVLQQDLSFLTKGLSFRGSISWDNAFVESDRGINDLFNSAQQKWIDPDTGIATYKQDFENNNKFDFAQKVSWKIAGGSVNNGQTLRNLNYQTQLNWGREFGKHNISAMGVFSRQETATGSQIPSFREDWVFRTTYGYANKYFFEYNGAYNGSEKFDIENRFVFFNSGAIGWMITEEKFMKSLKFIDMLKMRASYGEIGDDNVRDRWLYLNQWAYGGTSSMDVNYGRSPYAWYRETVVGNPGVKWETVRKTNFGLDYSFFNGLLAGSVEVFNDNRRDILVSGSQRAVPFYYGATPPTFNIGRVSTEGYELELRVNKVLANKMRLWANLSMTHAKNTVIDRDDPELLPAYQKSAGYSIGQNKAFVDAGFVNNYDEIYGSVAHDRNDLHKLPGDYSVIDFNADGIIDAKDNVPYGYTDSPQNTYNATLGFEWKGFSTLVQFYGVSNVTREVNLTSFGSRLNTVYDLGTWWANDRDNPEVTTPRWSATPSYNNGTQYMFDGSYVRLKNAEIAYTFKSSWVKSLGLNNLRIFLNGNNLWVWSKMPDDRESNFAGSGGQGAYPTMKRYNLGLKLTL